MTEHEQLIKAAEEAIDAVFSDTTVSPDETILDLKELRSEIQIKISLLLSDVRGVE